VVYVLDMLSFYQSRYRSRSRSMSWLSMAWSWSMAWPWSMAWSWSRLSINRRRCLGCRSIDVNRQLGLGLCQSTPRSIDVLVSVDRCLCQSTSTSPDVRPSIDHPTCCRQTSLSPDVVVDLHLGYRPPPTLSPDVLVSVVGQSTSTSLDVSVVTSRLSRLCRWSVDVVVDRCRCRSIIFLFDFVVDRCRCRSTVWGPWFPRNSGPAAEAPGITG